jgi:hypothetical protein
VRGEQKVLRRTASIPVGSYWEICKDMIERSILDCIFIAHCGAGRNEWLGLPLAATDSAKLDPYVTPQALQALQALQAPQAPMRSV